MTFSHILIATDFSDCSAEAVRVGAQWAIRFGARVTLVHVFDPWPMSPAVSYPATRLNATDTRNTLKQTVDKELKEIALDALSGVEKVEVLSIEHPAAAFALTDYADRNDADLIVIGTHGRTGVDRLLIGSVAERTVRYAKRPVLTVRPGLDPASFPKRVMVATDFSNAADAAFAPARAVAAKFGSTVVVSHVYETTSPLLMSDDAHFDEMREVDDELRDKLQTAMRDQLAGVEQVDMAYLSAPSPVTALCDYASENGIELMVMSTHGRTGLSRLLIGSVAERVVRHAPCSVMTIHTGEEA